MKMAKARPPVPARLHPAAVPDPGKLAASILALDAADPVSAGRRALEEYRAAPSPEHAGALADALETALQQVFMLRQERLQYMTRVPRIA